MLEHTKFIYKTNYEDLFGGWVQVFHPTHPKFMKNISFSFHWYLFSGWGWSFHFWLSWINFMPTSPTRIYQLVSCLIHNEYQINQGTLSHPLQIDALKVQFKREDLVSIIIMLVNRQSKQITVAMNRILSFCQSISTQSHKSLPLLVLLILIIYRCFCIEHFTTHLHTRKIYSIA